MIEALNSVSSSVQMYLRCFETKECGRHDIKNYSLAILTHVEEHTNAVVVIKRNGVHEQRHWRGIVVIQLRIVG